MKIIIKEHSLQRGQVRGTQRPLNLVEPIQLAELRVSGSGVITAGGFQGPVSLQLAGFRVRCHYSWRVSGSAVITAGGFQGPLSLQLAGFMVRCHYSWRVSGSGVEWVTVIFGRSPPPGGEAPSVVGLVMSVRPCIHPKP